MIQVGTIIPPSLFQKKEEEEEAGVWQKIARYIIEC
jgi:hypothetical protein